MFRFFVLSFAMLAPLVAQSHTFLVKPDQAQVTEGQPVHLSVLMTEKLFASERLLRVEDIQIHLLANGRAVAIKLKSDEHNKKLRGEVVAPTGTLLLTAKAVPRYRAMEKGAHTQDPTQTLRIEAFSKALVNLKKGDQGHLAKSGDRLELIVLDNPAELSVGGSLRIKVLFEDQPLVGKVWAMTPGKPRIGVETDSQGIANLTLNTAGFWVLSVRHHIEEADIRSAHYEANANLLFAID